MKYLSAFLIMFTFFSAFGQTEELIILPEKLIIPQQPDSVYEFNSVQEPAEFPGGAPALIAFVSKEIIYPEECLKQNLEGRVYLEFIVDQNGKVINPKILRGLHKLLNDEAVRVVSLMPDWKPAFTRGKKVKQRYILPVSFKIPRQEEKK